MVRSAITWLIEPCNSKWRKKKLLYINTVGICNIHSSENSGISKYFSSWWIDDKTIMIFQCTRSTETSWLTSDCHFLPRWSFSTNVNCGLFMKKTQLECFHSKGQFSFFPSPQEVWWTSWDPLCPLQPLWARVWVELPLAVALPWFCQAFLFWWKNTWLIWIASLTFGNICIFSPAWVKRNSSNISRKFCGKADAKSLYSVVWKEVYLSCKILWSDNFQWEIWAWDSFNSCLIKKGWIYFCLFFFNFYSLH